MFDHGGMGFNNPDVSWSELERTLSDRSRRPTPPRPSGANGGDSPAWSSVRSAYVPPARLERRAASVPYAELHCHSNFSFLDGSSAPEELAEEAARLGLDALALTDHDGFYGVVRFAEAARAVGVPTVFGAELSLDLTRPQNGAPDPEGSHLLVVARDPQGYAALASAISAAQLAGAEKGKPVYDGIAFEEVHRDHWLVLTGCRKGAVPRALMADGPAAAARELQALVATFGRHNVVVELCDHGHPLDAARNDALASLAMVAGVEVVATTNAHYATPAQRRLATAMAAVRARRSLDELDSWLPGGAGAHLRSGEEQTRRFARWPGAVATAAELGRACAFDLHLVAPKLPPYLCPDGLDEMAFLRRLTEEGATARYGPRGAERVPGAYAQIDHELALIEALGFPGYFLVVWDIVTFCRRKDIYCQGRGSAANSAVCYALGITSVDAVQLGLLFERFLSPERDGPPDIDIDIESGRREEAIQHVYELHGRRHAAQVANVITYRAKSSVRDMAKALGYAPGQQDAWSKQVDAWGPLAVTARQQAEAGGGDIPGDVLALAAEIEHAPRHLGIHSGGMVICDRPIVEVCPVEWARMEDRSVLQWDKDDCAAIGLVKFDLLGLGMLEVLHGTIDHIAATHGTQFDLATLPQDDEVYDMLCRADSVGVFQVESRAQMATLPRLRPRRFYDLVVEVALIRPGPIQGGSVHPYIRRRNGQEEVTYLHPLLEPSLAKTLGVPLFQEQLMQMAIDVGGFSPGEADQLRQAMGSKRSHARMERLHQRFVDGALAREVTRPVAEKIWEKLAAFASYGFPESHSVSFAYLVYASSWLKRFYPAAFCAGLLDAQPMGFYAPHTLVQDARRHGVEVRRPDLNASAATATLQLPDGVVPGAVVPAAPCGAAPETWGRGGPAVRLGLSYVRGLGDDLAAAIAAGRPYDGPEDLARRVPLTLPQLEALATAGALDCFGVPRREALWAAGAAAQVAPGRGGALRLPGIVTGLDAPPLPPMTPAELGRADLWATGVSPEGHPTRFVRPYLDERGVVTAAGLAVVEPGTRVQVAGVVTHRQRPATAGGTMFVNLEDETGLINVVVSAGCWRHHLHVARTAPAMLVRGRLERAEGVTNVIADRLERLPLDARTRSRDFR
ncbi:MAG: error-prone DNA polymerase [Acidimicrobiales bacterium]|nr:error-prone DNA polymerase [Acidimicrobiales bacterium]